MFLQINIVLIVLFFFFCNNIHRVDPPRRTVFYREKKPLYTRVEK